MNLFSLKSKTAVITGGAGYFGKRFIQGLLEAGIDKVINVEYPGTGTDFHKRLIKKYGAKRVALYEVDLYNEKATETCYNKILKENKKVDILINNAFEFSPRTGFALGRKETIKSATHEEFHHSFESSIWWAVQATRKFGPFMQKRGQGSIINIASPLGVIAPSPLTYKGFNHSVNPPAYGPMKAALLQWTRYSASFLAPVRVNALSPGAVPNLKEGRHRAGKEYDDQFLPNLAKHMILGRCGEVTELVGPLIFLASDASSYVTGLNLLVDGGWTQI